MALQRAILRQITWPRDAGFVTVSIGACAVVDKGISYEELLHRADNAVYQAKRRGKNQCCVSER